MDTKLIIEIIKIVAYVVLGGLSIWYSANAKLKGQVIYYYHYYNKHARV